MKKFYLTLGLSALLFSVNAQQGARQIKISPEVLTYVDSKQGNNQVSTTTCSTLTTIGSTDTISLFTAGTTTASSGYVCGNNSYGDNAKATFLPGALVPAGGMISGVVAIFYQKSATIGTHGTGTISLDILNGDTTNGPTGAAVATATASLAAISTMSVTNSQITYLFNLASPVAAPVTGFFSSLNLPTTTGDTAVLLCTKYKNHHASYAWDKNPGNTGTGWLSFSKSVDWGLQTSLTLLPVICTTTGINKNILEASLAVFPNPSNGEFNFAVALSNATNLTINVVNNLGQTVFTKTENNISSGVLNYDLSSLGKGIYSVNITDSQNNKVVKKVVIQ
ncbi:MAG TPA: T9SS type A sorting domain-containing protein [Bacteroidia bacterium]|jgi:hypothetical protein|nr:T9SS type A sorting domain-containing protein [Bacteroidia bacterium]